MAKATYVVNVEGWVVRDRRYLMIVRGLNETHDPGALSCPGGKVEVSGYQENVLEETLRREIREEVGVEVEDEMVYVKSSVFELDSGEPTVDIVFLCRYKSGEPRNDGTGEVEEVVWLAADEIYAHPQAREWTRSSLRRIEALEQAGGRRP